MILPVGIDGDVNHASVHLHKEFLLTGAQLHERIVGQLFLRARSEENKGKRQQI